MTETRNNCKHGVEVLAFFTLSCTQKVIQSEITLSINTDSACLLALGIPKQQLKSELAI
jgi:hypothetical protein